MQVRVFRDRLPELLKTQITSSPAIPAVDDTSVAKLFEEVKVMVRELPEKLDSQLQTAGRRGSRRPRHFHPMMLEELLMHPGMRENPDGQAAAWLMFISSMRDDYPWLYEIGLDVYRALRSGSPEQLGNAKDSFQRAIRSISRMRMSREFFGEDDEAFMILRHLPEMIDPFLERIGTTEDHPKAKRIESARLRKP
jgi:hypothetical protein